MQDYVPICFFFQDGEPAPELSAIQEKSTEFKEGGGRGTDIHLIVYLLCIYTLH